jgi:hypothetical protein
MSRIHPERIDSGPSDRSATAHILLRQEPDEDENEEEDEDEDDDKENEDDDEEIDDGYSE